MKTVLKIGIDFDNTIICYDEVFNITGVKERLIPNDLPHGKNCVRNYLRENGQEEDWIKLQGLVYGTRLDDAYPYTGVKSFFSYCENISLSCSIISHKTVHPYRGFPYDLHKSAYQWLKKEEFDCDIYFELTIDEKIRRIEKLGCTHFIDDLPEFLMHPDFPENTKKILFDPLRHYTKETVDRRLKIVHSWSHILNMVKSGKL